VRTNFGAGAAAVQLDLFFEASHSWSHRRRSQMRFDQPHQVTSRSVAEGQDAGLASWADHFDPNFAQYAVGPAGDADAVDAVDDDVMDREGRCCYGHKRFPFARIGITVRHPVAGRVTDPTFVLSNARSRARQALAGGHPRFARRAPESQVRNRLPAGGRGIEPSVPGRERRPYRRRSRPVNLDRADLRRSALVVSVPANLSKDHTALSSERRLAFLEPAGPTGSDMPASAKGASIGFSEGPQCLTGSLAVKDGGPGREAPPGKPKWMRWRTYERKYEIWERAVDEANAEFTVRAARILKLL
jgi:hypothetical protein